MPTEDPINCTAFADARRIASGHLSDVALAAKRAAEAAPTARVLIYDDLTGRVIDVDTRGRDDEIVARLSPPAADLAPRGRGRPKLGVVAREVTLLPRHWEWLRAQPGGASVALRKLVEEARRNGGGREHIRIRREAAYRFLAAMAGDLPCYEEALRALFAGDRAGFETITGAWPHDVRDYGLILADGSWKGEG